MVAKKEIISILLILAAVLCLLNGLLFGNILNRQYSVAQTALQATSVSTAYICLLHGLSTWFYNSNFPRPRQLVRIVLITILIVMIVANIGTCYFYAVELTMDKLKDSTDISEIFTDFDELCITITLVLSIVIVVLLFIALLLVCVKFLRKQQRKMQRHQRRQKNKVNE